MKKREALGSCTTILFHTPGRNGRCLKIGQARHHPEVWRANSYLSQDLSEFVSSSSSSNQLRNAANTRCPRPSRVPDCYSLSSHSWGFTPLPCPAVQDYASGQSKGGSHLARPAEYE